MDAEETDDDAVELDASGASGGSLRVVPGHALPEDANGMRPRVWSSYQGTPGPPTSPAPPTAAKVAADAAQGLVSAPG
jgi:hypothetical protein